VQGLHIFIFFLFNLFDASGRGNLPFGRHSFRHAAAEELKASEYPPAAITTTSKAKL
jgi:hypothetical protein